MSTCLNLLIVEDKPADFRLTVRHLEQYGLAARCHGVASLEELEAAMEQGGWDAVLSDYSVPGLDFQQTMQLLQARYPDLPLILVSGSIGEEKAVELLKQGVWDFVLKDRLARLVPAIERSLRDAAARREHKQAQIYREMGREVLQLLNQPGDPREVVQQVIAAVRTRTGVAAIGLRLQDGEDFPYYAQHGFPKDFLLTEHTLLERGADGGVCRNQDGQVCLECTCGLVLSGRTDPANPRFTTGGSYWTHDACPPLDRSTAQDPRRHSRNACLQQGYASVALVPIRHLAKIIGLLHLADRRTGGFTLATVELLEGIAASIGEALTRKHAEAELQKLNTLQSIGTLAGGIAHDFNNILQGLYGNIAFAKEDLPKGHPSYLFLDDAEKSMTRAVRLTKQLLTFAKGGAPIKEMVDLGLMIEELARFDLSGSNVNLVYHQDADLWPVEADKGQLQQVVSNLVINARQAMPNGGRLHLTVEKANLHGNAVTGIRPGRYVKVRVQDEGLGIDPAVISRIFDPYFTTKQTGSGLGLATVWSIITKHGGQINVISELGKGTVFTFYLPAAASALPAAAKLPAAACRTPAKTAKILVMDDEESVRRQVAKMLIRNGHSVVTAPGGQEALALYQQALADGQPFDLVMMDLTIPGGLGGQDTIKRLLALDPHATAIVSSGYAEDPIMANPAVAGFKGAIIKPYTANALREVIARLLP
jgi:signal transduction histidine kinase/DNA-binding response OmpR family regulator